MIAAHRRLNHAHALVDLAAGSNVEDDVAGLIRKKGPGSFFAEICLKRSPAPFFVRAQMPFDCLADERAEFLFVHLDDSTTSTLSTIPTMAASTGAAFFPMASLAERPSRTMSTFSPTPAPAPSTASSSPPRGVSSRLRGCTSSSLPPSSLRCFCVETTVPTTRASSMAALSDGPVIDDAHDARVGRHLSRIERKARLFAADEKHMLAHAGAHRIRGPNHAADGFSSRRDRLHEQQRHAAQ